MTDARIFYVRLEGCGPSAARNAGARRGAATWIAFVDCDDAPKPNWLSTMMSSGVEADIVSCAADGVMLRSGSAFPAEDYTTARLKEIKQGEAELAPCADDLRAALANARPGRRK